MRYKLSETALMTGGRLEGEDAVVTRIEKDSRKVKPGDLFIAISGENFDGHNFLKQVAESGAAGALVSRYTDGCGLPQVVADDTRLALGRLAQNHCARFDIPKAAVTGSVGKTTTRDMVAAVLSAHFKKVHKTQGNFNNDIGLPFTVIEMDETNDAAVFEMGMNHFGEIDYLSNIVHPDIAVITNVGTAHIENLGSREGILKAKCEIFNGMKPDGFKVLNGDDDMLSTVKGENICFYSKSADAKEKGADIYATNITQVPLESTSCTINTGELSFDVTIPAPGEHMVSNALAAAAVGLHLGLTPDEIAAGIASFVPTAGRMDIERGSRYTIINGVYNANPDSMKASIEVLRQADGFKCAILGDMLELGEYSREMHEDVGRAADGLDLVIAVGKHAWDLYSMVKSKALYFETVEALAEAVTAGKIVPDGAAVLVKASHSMHLERVVEALMSI